MKNLKETESVIPANSIGDGIPVASFDPLLKIKKMFKRWNPIEVDNSRHTGPTQVHGIKNSLNNKNMRRPWYEKLQDQAKAALPGKPKKAKSLRDIVQ